MIEILVEEYQDLEELFWKVKLPALHHLIYFFLNLAFLHFQVLDIGLNKQPQRALFLVQLDLIL